MLQAKGVDRQQVNTAKGGVRILAGGDFIKDGAATVQADR
jgi:hypothetical protein